MARKPRVRSARRRLEPARLATFVYTTAWLFLLIAAALAYNFRADLVGPGKIAEWEKSMLHSVWFAMLGGVAISYKGIYDHWKHSDWASGGWGLWYVGRPLSGAITGIMTYLLLQVVNPNQTPSLPTLAVAAFVLGMQDKRFFQFLASVSKLILTVPDDYAQAKPAPKKPVLAPASGVVPDTPPAAGPPAGTSFSDHGGLVLLNANLVLVFWGKTWEAGASPSAQEVSGAVAEVLASDYLSGLKQYRGIQGATLKDSITVADSDPPAVFRDDDVADLLQGLMSSGKIVEPDQAAELLYCVVMPPGCRFQDEHVIGEHSYFLYWHLDLGQLDVDVNWAHFAWVTNDGTLDSLTTILSHELVESCTDPEGTGWTADSGPCPPTGWCEIGDVCGDTGVVNGVTVQSYWSQSDAACVIPGKSA